MGTDLLKIGLLSLCSLLSAQDLPGDTDKLVHVNIVYRHGDRAPISIYKNDPNNAEFWQRGLGQLTKEGCRMHYHLGSFLRAHYSNFLDGVPREIRVQSSDADRCLDSANCHLAGMFRPAEDQVFMLGLKWQPVPVHTRPNTENGLLAPGNGNCPNADKEYRNSKKSGEGKKFIEKYADFYRNLSRWTGENITDWDHAGHIYDVIMIERLYGLTVPDWAIEYFDELENQEDAGFVWYAKTPSLQKFRAGLLAKEILQNFQDASNKSNPVKVHMYSTHDTEVAALLTLFGLFDNKSPKYCATVLTELWQNVATHSYSVKVYYLNFFDMKPRLLLEASLKDFQTRLAPKIPVDWNAECGNKKQRTEETIFRHDYEELLALCGLIVLLLMIAFCCMYCDPMRRRKPAPYHLLPTEQIS